LFLDKDNNENAIAMILKRKPTIGSSGLVALIKKHELNPVKKTLSRLKYILPVNPNDKRYKKLKLAAPAMAFKTAEYLKYSKASFAITLKILSTL